MTLFSRTFRPASLAFGLVGAALCAALAAPAGAQTLELDALLSAGQREQAVSECEARAIELWEGEAKRPDSTESRSFVGGVRPFMAGPADGVDRPYAGFWVRMRVNGVFKDGSMPMPRFMSCRFDALSGGRVEMVGSPSPESKL